MAQFGRPDSTIAAGGWTSTGATLYEVIDETSASDADYISAGSTATTARIGLSDVTDPVSSTGHTVRYRGQSNGSGSPERITVELRQGTTLIATVSSSYNITRGSPENVSYTLTGTEADAITDYTALELRFIVATLASGETLQVFWAELETPDAPASALSVNVSDSITVSESVGVSVGSAAFSVSVSDSVTITESIDCVFEEPGSTDWTGYRRAMTPGVATSWDEVLWGGNSGQPIKVNGVWYFYYCGRRI
jgi:hypothetical protein